MGTRIRSGLRTMRRLDADVAFDDGARSASSCDDDGLPPTFFGIDDGEWTEVAVPTQILSGSETQSQILETLRAALALSFR